MKKKLREHYAMLRYTHGLQKEARAMELTRPQPFIIFMLDCWTYEIRMRIKMIKCKITGHNWEMWDEGNAEDGPITHAECSCCGVGMEPSYGM